MSSILIIIAVIAAISAIALLLVAYYVMRHMRGSIKMTLANTSAAAGEPISGSFSLATKKQIEGKRLFVALVGKEITEERHGDRTRTDTREIFRDEKIIEDERTYPAGFSADYSFELTAPSGGTDSAGEILGDVVNLGMDLLSGERSRVDWHVETRLDAAGIDLAASRQVYINI